MIIIGAGMAGLLAANMLRMHKPVIYERAESLPNNHAAVLRFKTDAVSRATAIPFKEVRVHKEIWWPARNSNLIWAMNTYAYKVTDRISARSLKEESVNRYVAPTDFVDRLAKTCNIEYGREVEIGRIWGKDSPVISTVPMPIAMEQLGWEPVPEFSYKKGFVVKATIQDCDVYQTVYCPDRGREFYRASITGNELMVEYLVQPTTVKGDLEEILYYMGIPEDLIDFKELRMAPMRYSKIDRINEKVRKDFLHYLTDKYNVYSLGRFATWKPGLLLDDVVQDVRRIEHWITEGEYELRKGR